jgi:molybdenum cofactor synthesis domain-containing protein
VRHVGAARGNTAVITIREARAVVLERARGERATERVAVTAAVGRVLAAPVLSDTDLPPFDRVMMDGFAVRAADVAPGARLRVVSEVAAGARGERPLAAGEAHAIMTGAPLPPGADAVVPVEWTRTEGEAVSIDRGLKPGANVAPRAEDLRAGQLVARAGEAVSAMSLSLLIAGGAAEVSVVRRPRVALLTSGNELVPPGAPLQRGQIRESNGPALAALLAQTGAEVQALGVARDTREDLDRLLARTEGADVVVLTGGSSVGKYDYSAEAVEARGATRVFDRISIKPGKPTLFHVRGPQLIFCLPGNPVAALMTGRVLVAAALAALGGRAVPDWTPHALPLGGKVKRVAERDLLAPMRREGGVLVFDGWNGSGDLACLARAEGFAFVARGAGEAAPGTPADWFPIPPDGAW